MEVFKLERVSYYEYYSDKSIKVYAYDGHGNQTNVRQVQVRFKYEYNGSKWVLNPFNPDHSPYNQLYYSEDGSTNFNTLDNYKKEFEKEEGIQAYRFFIRYAPVNSDAYYPAVEIQFAFSEVFVCNGQKYFAQSYSFIDITEDNKESIAANIKFFDFLKRKDNSYIEVDRDMTGDELLQYKTAIVAINKLYKTNKVDLPVYPGFFLTKLKPEYPSSLYSFNLKIPEDLDQNNVYYENSAFPKRLLGFESIGYRAQKSGIIGPQNKNSFPSNAPDSSKNGSYCFKGKPSSSLNFKGVEGDYSNCLPIYLPDETNGNPDFNLLVKGDTVEINGVTAFRAANGFRIKNLIIGERNLIDFNSFSFTNERIKSSKNFYPCAAVDYNNKPDSFGYYEAYETMYETARSRNWNTDSSHFQDLSLGYYFRRVKPTSNISFLDLMSSNYHNFSGVDENTLSLLKSEWFNTYKRSVEAGIKTSSLEPTWESYTPPQMSGTLWQGYSIEYFYKNTRPTFKLIPTCFSSMPSYDAQNTNVQYLQYNIQTNQIISASDDKAYFPGSRKEQKIVILSASEPYDEGPNNICVMLTNKKDDEPYYGCGFISINASDEWANTKVFRNPEDPSDFDYFNNPSLLNSGHPNKNNTPKIVFVELEKTE